MLAIAAALPGASGCRFHRRAQGAAAAVGAPLPSRWELSAGRGTCEIDFSFPPPHEMYSGEVRAATGRVEVDRGGRLRGEFLVHVDDVDMGEPDLTENVREAAEMLRGKDFPDASFRFDWVEPALPVSAGARESEVTLDGTFRLKGVELPLVVPAKLRLLGGADNWAPMDLRAAFQLEGLHERFGISGPGGAGDPSGDTLRFTIHFVLVPCENAAP